MVDSVSPQNHPRRFCLAMKVFKRKETSSQLMIEMGGQNHHTHTPPTACRLIDFLWFFPRGSLVYAGCCSPRWLKEEKPRKRSGHLLMTYPSFLLLWSREKNQLVRPGVVSSRDLKRGGAGFNISDKTHLSEHHSISVWSWMKICNFMLTERCLHRVEAVDVGL